MVDRNEHAVPWEQVLDALPVAVVVCRSGRTVHSNVAARSLLSAGPDGELARAGGPLDGFCCRSETCRQGGRPETDVAVAAPSGETSWVHVTTAPLPAELGAGCVIAAVDVTARHRQEEKARECEQGFVQLFEHLPWPTHVWRGAGDDLVLVRANRAGRAADGALRLEGGRRPLASEVHAQEPSIVATLLRCLNERRTLRREVDCRSLTTGVTRRLDMTFSHVPPDLVVAQAQDVTDAPGALAAMSDRLRELAVHCALVEEHERRRIASELHDGPLQHLSAARLELGEARAAAPGGDPSETLQRVDGLLHEAIVGARSLLQDLSPPLLEEGGLLEAVTRLARRIEADADLRCSVQCAGAWEPLALEVSVTVYQAARELLANAAKHARASHVVVRLEGVDGWVRLSVEDDGCGFEVAWAEPSAEGGFGLFGLRERLLLLGGRLEVDSEPGRGTRVMAEAPRAGRSA